MHGRGGRARHLLLALALLAVIGLGSACEAPLQPDSRKSEAAGPTGSASPSVGPSTSPATPAPTGSAPPSPTAAPTPSITVPPLPKPRDLGAVLGGDISWPQCPKGMGIPEKRSLGLPLPDASARFVVIGLTNGPGFVANPCLADQVAWAQSRHLLVAAYSVISGQTHFTPADAGSKGPYDGSTRLGALGNIGYQQARFNVASMRRVGLQTPFVWLDVESVPHFEWGPDTQANAAVVRGAARGYQEAGYAVGVYSTPYLYRNVVGDLALRVPEWRAAGQTSRTEALRRCRRDWVIQGGAAVLGQWVEGNRDRNVTCPGTSLDLLRWFRQY
jgi:hypothetical protein